MFAEQHLMKRVYQRTALAEIGVTKSKHFEDKATIVTLKRLRSAICNLHIKWPHLNAMQRIVKLFAKFESSAQEQSDKIPSATANGDKSTNTVESCNICGYALPFENAQWARCMNDHRFGMLVDEL